MIANQAAPYEALADASGDMFKVAQKYQLRQDAMDLAVLERQYDETFNSYADQLRKTTDAEQAAKLSQEFATKSLELSNGSRKNVQQAFTANVNRTVGKLQYELSKITEASLQRDAIDKHRFARQRAIESGDELSVRKYDALALETGTIGQEEYNSLTESVPVDLILTRAYKTADVNPKQAIADIQELKTGASNIIGRELSTDEIARANKIISIANSQTDTLSAEANKNLTMYRSGYWLY